MEHANGHRTAWIDKHPAYDILNGPGAPAEGPGGNIDDFFAPQIDAALTREIPAAQLYDGLKAGAILHEIADRSIGRMLRELRAQGLASSTLMIVTAEHGNAPIDRTRLKIISNRTVLTPALDTRSPLDRFHIADDVLVEWLAAGHHADVQAVIDGLLARQAAGTDLGIGRFYSGRELTALLGDPLTDPRAPDFVLSPRLGHLRESPGEDRRSCVDHEPFSSCPNT